MEMNAAVLIASDSRSVGTREELCIPVARECLARQGIHVLEVAIVPDERDRLAEKMREWIGRADIHLILTSGGTGLTPRDVTPEATRMVIEKEVPGIAEYLRSCSIQVTPKAALSRAIAGTANRTLVINLPGSPKAVRESIDFLVPILPHALETVGGFSSECGR